MSNTENTRYAKHITNFDIPEIMEIVDKVIAGREYYDRQYFHRDILQALKDDPSGSTLPERVTPQEKRDEWARRLRRATELWGTRVTFDVCKLDDNTRAKILSLLPDFLKHEEVELTIHDIYDGDFVLPHIDHKRKSSLFYLYSAPDMETVWWKDTNGDATINGTAFTIYDEFRYPDPDKIVRDFSITMQQNQWYLIDQETWHSAHKLPEITPKRTTFVIQFPKLTYKEMLSRLTVNSH